RTVSDGDRPPTLATPGGENGPTRARAHPQPEPVRLVPTTVVGLERALHAKISRSLSFGRCRRFAFRPARDGSTLGDTVHPRSGRPWDLARVVGRRHPPSEPPPEADQRPTSRTDQRYGTA